jgi:hypothetical protein
MTSNMEREGVQYAVSLFTRSEGPNRNILNAHGRSCEENPPKLSPGENQNKRVFGQAGPTRTRRHEILRPLPHPTARVHPVPWAGSTRAPRRVGTRAAAGPAREHVGHAPSSGRGDERKESAATLAPPSGFGSALAGALGFLRSSDMFFMHVFLGTWSWICCDLI